tara:strand:+ start:3090 stop:4217 length:1128 start_codon:yes stop_codon:yes gene_type:complete
MKTFITYTKAFTALFLLTLGSSAYSQTNVFDDVIATSPNHTYLEAALIQEGLNSALIQNPNITVFAPDDSAFLDLAASLNTDISGLLALPNLNDILLYHVLGVSANSSSLNNGDIVFPLSSTNTIKLTVNSSVYANHAMVNAADLIADNGIVHSTDAVLLPNETVIDVALDNGFTSLSAAVIQQGLLPVLTDPFATFTVFAPTDQAFTNTATALGTDINGLLALPNLTEILTYHVLDTYVLSTSLTNGPVATINGENINVDLTMGVMINDANVITADVTADNGVVHILDKVLLPAITGLTEIDELKINIYPNPSTDFLNLDNANGDYIITNLNGQVVDNGSINGDPIDVRNLSKGNYIISVTGDNIVSQLSFIKR